LVRGILKINFDKDNICETCVKNEHVKNIFQNKDFVLTKRPLELLHI